MSHFQPSKATGDFVYQGSQPLPVVPNDEPSSSSNQVISLSSPHPNISSNFTSNDVSPSPKRKVASLGISGQTPSTSSKKRKKDNSKTDDHPQLEAFIAALGTLNDTMSVSSSHDKIMAATSKLHARYEKFKDSEGSLTMDDTFELMMKFKDPKEAAVYLGLREDSDMLKMYEDRFKAQRAT